MAGMDDIDIFGVPVTGSTRDRDLDRLEQMVRGRYIDPLEQQAKDMVKSQVVQALSGMEGVTGAAIAQIVALADSRDPNDKLVFNQIVSRLNLPVNIRRMGDDYMASKRFEGALGRDSSVDVMAYRPDKGETQYSLGAQKRFPNLLGKNSSADVSARVSTMGDPEIRARFEKRFAEGGEVDIFDEPVGQMNRRQQPKDVARPTPAQLANIGAAFADPLGMVDIMGEYPEFPAAGVSTAEMVMQGPRSPSLMENLREGSLGSAGLQMLGMIPVLGGALRSARGLGKAAEGIGSLKGAEPVSVQEALEYAADREDLVRLVANEADMRDPAFLQVLNEHPYVVRETARLEEIPVTSANPDYGSDDWVGSREFFFDDDSLPVIGYEFGVEKLYEKSRTLGFTDDKMEYPGPVARAEGQKPQAVIVLGPPASGKSSISNPIARKLDATIIDSDEAKKLLPEYEGGIGANAVHQESKRITEMVQEIAVAKQDNLVIPTVGDDAGKIRKKIDELKDAGYEVDLVDVKVPKDVANARMLARFANTGRIIPSSYIAEVGDNPTKTFDILRQENYADGFTRIDNSVGRADAKPVEEDTRKLLEGTEIQLSYGRGNGGSRGAKRTVEGDRAANLGTSEEQKGIGSL